MMRPIFLLATLTLAPLTACQNTHPPVPTPHLSPRPEKLTPVPGRPGFYLGTRGGYLDLRGFPSGTQIRDPYSGQILIVP